MARRSLAAALVAVVLAASCASGDDPEPAAEPTAPPATPAEPDPTAAPVSLREELDEQIAPFAADPFPCLDPAGTAAGGPPIEVGFLNADFSTVAALNFAVDLGDEAAHFRAIMDDINERCGGVRGRPLVVNEYEFDPVDSPGQLQVCTESTQEADNLIVIGRALLGDNILCITEANEVPYLALLGAVDPFYERSGGRLFTMQMNLDLALASSARDLIANGQITSETSLGVVWGDSTDQNIAVMQSLGPELDRAGISWTEAVLQESNLICDGYATAVERLRAADVDTVLATLNPVCYPGFVLEATNQGWFPTYLVPEYGNMNSDISTQRMADAGDAFDGAIGITFSPTGGRRLPGVPAWDKACNELIASRVEVDWGEGDEQHPAAAQVCSAAWVVYNAAHGAGEELDRSTLVDAMERLDAIPLEGDLIGRFGPDHHWAPEQVVHTIVWELDCVCWQLRDGPRLVR